MVSLFSTLRRRPQHEHFRLIVLLRVGITLTFTAVGFIAVSAWHTNEAYQHRERRERAFEKLLREIALSNDLSSTIVRRLATGDDHGDYRNQYETNLRQMNSAVAQALAAESDAAQRATLQRLREAHGRLLAREQEVLALAAGGDLRQSQERVADPEYLREQQEFLDVIRALDGHVDRNSEQNHAAYRQHLMQIAAWGISLTVIFAGAWVLVLRLTRRSLERLQRATTELQESETKYRTLIDALPHGVVILQDHRVVFGNNAAAQLFGFSSAEQLIGVPTAQMLPERDRERILALADAAYAGEATVPEHVISTMVRAGHEEFPVESFIRMVVFNGRPAMQIVQLDVTERERAAAALRESEERFRMLADSAPVLIWMGGVNRHSFYFNRMWLTFRGRSLGQEYGQGWAEGVHPEDLARYRGLYQTAFQAHRPYTIEYRLYSHDGTYHWVLESAVPRLTPAGDFAGFIGTCVDITDRRQTEELLRAGERKYRELVDLLPEAVFEADKQGRLTFANRRAFDLFGYSQRDLERGATAFDMLEPGERTRALENFRRVLGGEQIPGKEYSARCKSGAVFPVKIESAPILIDGEVRGLRGVIIDLSALKQVQRDLEHKTTELEALFRALPDLTFRITAETTVLDYHCGTPGILLLPPEQFLGRRLTDVMPPHVSEELAATVERVRAQGTEESLEYDLQLADTSRSFEARIVPKGAELLVLVRDITERRRAERALSESQRMLLTLMSNLPGMAYRCRNDAAWTMEFVSDGAQPLLGYQPEDVIANRRIAYADLILPEDQYPVWQSVQAGVEARQPFHMSYRIRTATGEVKRVSEQGRGVFAADGQLLALEGFIFELGGESGRQDRVRALAEAAEDALPHPEGSAAQPLKREVT